ncbi:uncharacterized protein F5147DRAFT_647325 [Suillus discolor]|uniref:Uncharacterized protein n=1 Tax=Suillus discolor TaxID=1912936 RepID=A0A9P7FPY1_9AGAM|nr:uncharacterized protein F5147DRAFT_647325 [Suillus discolor]KAG2120948.1 hypothetical protein F5147DRAFT_647325 [Suillus discolor]
MWIRVWYLNHNPQLILTYYLNTIEKLEHIPMVTQSDPSTENYGITNAHTMLHQMYDLALQGTLQHCWMWTKKNFTPGFETLLDEGVESGWYDSDNTLQVCAFSMIFRWVFIPWLQCELDRYFHMVTVKQDAIDHICNLYCSAQVSAIVRSLTDVTDLDKEPLPLLENQKDLFFMEILMVLTTWVVFMADKVLLDELAELDEPSAHLLPTAPIVEEEGLVIMGFSDEEDNDETYD